MDGNLKITRGVTRVLNTVLSAKYKDFTSTNKDRIVRQYRGNLFL
jgi:hypothetical protein